MIVYDDGLPGKKQSFRSYEINLDKDTVYLTDYNRQKLRL